MKTKILTLIIMLSTLMNAQEIKKAGLDNPFFRKYDTPFEVPPFERIKNEHFAPAFVKGIEEHDIEIEKISKNKASATFKNTILAMENSGELLRRASSVFYPLYSANTNEEMQKIAKEMAPKLSAHSDKIYMNDELFKRVNIVWENKEKEKLGVQELKVLENTYKAFLRSGAKLSKEDKEKLTKINSELSVLSLKFGQNLLADTNNYELVIENEKDLAGLPAEQIEQASITAKAKGKEGKWVFTLSNASIMPFLQYSDNRQLRKTIWQAYKNRCNNGGENDNNEIGIKMANLRMQKAKLLGYESHAAFILEENMAKTPQKVYDFLQQLWTPTLKKLKEEEDEISVRMKADNIDGEVQPYDWRYYSEKISKEKYELDEQELKPFFSLDAVTKGLFMVCEKLYGIRIQPLKNMPTYHAEATAWEVLEKDGTHIGVVYMDFHPRESKRGGAWCTSYRPQQIENGKRKSPIISIVCNFSKPTISAPALFSLDEVRTYFHEFGHALHGLLSNVQYRSLAGTSVPRDFVELPSQIMENWATDPLVLKMYAKHYKTGEIMPDRLIEKLEKADTYGQGFITAEYLASAFLDMDFHTANKEILGTAEDFEIKSMKKIGMPASIIPRHRANYFGHVFSGGYSAGYYSYIWSGVLDTDAFEQFKTTDLFNPEKSKSFRKNILEKGGSEEPMELYKSFKGSEPSIEPLLKKRGLNVFK